ncbi:MAG TPA: hypothetical protein VMQ60_01595 [Acidobacteriaceae bacterium]|jgi:hypothetical protein|nr:hypothetical protein [Acidobacteriaceae bacterium]
MSHVTPHIYRGFNVRFDELEPQNAITMSKSTWAALEQLESGSEEHIAKRYQVKAKSKFASLEHHALDSTHATEAEAKARARTLKDAGYETEVVPPTAAEEPPLSYARYRVQTRVNSSAPYVYDSSFAEEGDAQGHARDLESKDLDTQIIDGNTGSVVQNVYSDGTAIVPEADETANSWSPEASHAGGLPEHPVWASLRQPEHPVIANQPPAQSTSPNPADNVGTVEHGGSVPAETPDHEWLRKEAEAKKAHA